MNIRQSFILAILPVILTMCASETTRIPNPEALYLEDGVTVITTSYNARTQTTAILYGNTQARKAYAESIHVPGEDYRLVTWRQIPNPLWFGGNINDHINTIEVITTTASPDGTIHFDYQITQGNIATPKAQRLSYILNLKPIPFP